MITVKRADVDDFVLLATLGRKAFYEAFGAQNDPLDMQTYLNNAFDPQKIHAQLSDANCIFFIAYFDEDPVGYAKIILNYNPPDDLNNSYIQLERIYALQAFIGKKIGKALMTSCMDFAKEKKYTKIWLGVWQENKRAIDFYKNWGFEITGIKQFIIGKEVNDDYIMTATIA